MVFYVRQGKIPKTRHTYDSKNNLQREELFGEESFEGSYSLLYHRNEPTRIRSIKEVRKEASRFEVQEIHRLVDTDGLKGNGDFVTGRKPLFGNTSLVISISKPIINSSRIFRHGTKDQLIFVHNGRGTFASIQGEIEFDEGDYVYVPKGTIYSMTHSSGSEFLLIESKDNITIPPRYLNKFGQIKEGVPYYTRDIRAPILKKPVTGKGKYEVWVDFDDKYVIETRDTHPFDLDGWDGYHFPYAINVRDMMPIVGKVHLPPPVHETFSSRSFMVATFLPRKFDFHERAIPISYYHSNVDTDEFLYYASGNFMSRKGIREGSITLHVRGMIHGPQPGAVESALGKEETDELGIMVESYERLGMSEEAERLERKNYMKTWYE